MRKTIAAVSLFLLPGTVSAQTPSFQGKTVTIVVGTVAGDNTLIVLFPDEPSLDGWLERFDALNTAAQAAAQLTEAPVS